MTSCVTWSKSHNLSGPRILHLSKETGDSQLSGSGETSDSLGLTVGPALPGRGIISLSVMPVLGGVCPSPTSDTSLSVFQVGPGETMGAGMGGEIESGSRR